MLICLEELRCVGATDLPGQRLRAGEVLGLLSAASSRYALAGSGVQVCVVQQSCSALLEFFSAANADVVTWSSVHVSSGLRPWLHPNSNDGP